MIGAATAGWSKPLAAALSWLPLQVGSHQHVDLLSVDMLSASTLLNAACFF